MATYKDLILQHCAEIVEQVLDNTERYRVGSGKVEGWYEIPNTLVEYYGASSIAAEFVRLYFCALLILGGIIGMSFINSIFVDAMVADNNDDVMTKLNELQKSIDELKEKSNINH